MVIDFFGIEARFVTPFINRVHIENLFTAIIIAQHLGMKNVEIREALKEVTPLPGRGVVKQQKGFTIIDETYNSNPEDPEKNTGLGRPGVQRDKKSQFLGDMLELGENEEQFHKEMGHFFASLGFDRLITVGRRALKIAEGAAAAGFNTKKIKSVDSSAEAGRFLKEKAEPGSAILFKASRGIQLEKSIEEFQANEK